MRWLRRRLTVRRLMILVAVGAVLFAAARSTRRFRRCMDLVNDYAWFRSREPWAKGMVVGTKEQERARHGAQPPPDRLLCPAGSEVPWGSLAVLGDCPAGRSAFSLRESWDLCTCPSPHDWRGNCANFDCG